MGTESPDNSVPESKELEFDFQQSDYICFAEWLAYNDPLYAAAFKRGRQQRNAFLLLTALVTTAIVLRLTSGPTRSHTQDPVLLWLLGVFLFYLWWTSYSLVARTGRNGVRAWAKKLTLDPRICRSLGSRGIRFDRETVTWTTDETSYIAKWSSFSRVSETERLIVLEQSGSLTGLVVPKRAFRSQADASAFAAAAKCFLRDPGSVSE